MDSDYLKNFNEMLNVLEISSKDLRAGALCVPLYRSLYIDEMMAAHEELVEKRDESFAKLIEKFDNIKNMNFTTPPEDKNLGLEVFWLMIWGLERPYRLYHF